TPATPQGVFARALPQPIVAVATVVFGLVFLLAAWVRDGAPDPGFSYSALPLALGLTAAVVVAYRYPIHVLVHTKVLLITVVYYLLAALVPPALAGLAAGLGTLGGELLQRRRSGAYPSDMATEAGRRTIMVIIGSLVAHLGGTSVPAAWALIAAAIVLALLDILTVPLAIAPISGDRPLRVLITTARATWAPDGAQYIVGLLGAGAASRYPWMLLLLIVPGALVYMAFKIMREMHENTRQLLESLADAVDLRDAYTGGHSRRVTQYTADILGRLNMNGPEVALILAAARVHDIGKIGIPDAILHKAGRLTAEERAVMELHPVHGANLLKRYGDFARGVDIVLHHHEQMDGQGYPNKLHGAEIPFGARVIAVADSFDAMTSDRPYRPGMMVAKAAEILRAGRGTQWDPNIVDALLGAIGEVMQLTSPPPVPSPSAVPLWSASQPASNEPVARDVASVR
ncbi:MAG: hypothetical protein JWO59_238, partial [Chloroflexi bacterium]|nr:hypothetical protein [Chloroflexota bacterium]